MLTRRTRSIAGRIQAFRCGQLRCRNPCGPIYSWIRRLYSNERCWYISFVGSGTRLLEWEVDADKKSFRFLHVSTDEVYGFLDPSEAAFTETHTYAPNSPYSASKAASDHLVRAYHYTYGLPTLTTNCSNNYGPYHFPEKLIPLVIHNALTDKPLPIYGTGQQIRDWLYAEDHCAAIRRVLEAGMVGEVYNIGGWNEKPNIEVVKTLCRMLDAKHP